MSGIAHVSLADLVALRHRARGFSVLPGQPPSSVLAGRAASRLRGRGLDFDELRAFQPGDDVRTIDARATARTGRTHVRVYREERDRPVIVVVDQRAGMFFGSRRCMKSVLAAEAAALWCWRALAQGDRPGAVVFGTNGCVEVPAQRSERRVVAILDAVARANAGLHARSRPQPGAPTLDDVLERLERTASHDRQIVLISDLDGADEHTFTRLGRLARHDDVIVMLVHDPMEADLPDAAILVISDGDLQLAFDGRDPDLRARFRADFAALLDHGRRSLGRRGVPMLPLVTAHECLPQLIARLGGRGPAAFASVRSA